MAFCSNVRKALDEKTKALEKKDKMRKDQTSRQLRSPTKCRRWPITCKTQKLARPSHGASQELSECLCVFQIQKHDKSQNRAPEKYGSTELSYPRRTLLRFLR